MFKNKQLRNEINYIKIYNKFYNLIWHSILGKVKSGRGFPFCSYLLSGQQNYFYCLLHEGEASCLGLVLVCTSSLRPYKAKVYICIHNTYHSCLIWDILNDTALTRRGI